MELLILIVVMGLVAVTTALILIGRNKWQIMSDLISRADAIEVLQQFAEDEKPTDEMSKQFQQYQRGRHLAFLQAVEEIKALPSADAVREEYEETDGVVKIKKQSAKEVGEIKHIVVCSPNYTRYFYNDSMPIQYKGGDTE